MYIKLLWKLKITCVIKEVQGWGDGLVSRIPVPQHKT